MAPSVFTGRSFRVVAPRWAHGPLSGEGARRSGGRFNPPGMTAFYSALDPHTAYAEYTQALFDRPGLLCAFDIEAAAILDLTSPDGLAAAGLVPEDLADRWVGRSDTPTQRLAEVLMRDAFDGVIYPSQQRAIGRNLVLWRWQPSGGPIVRLIDRWGEAPSQPFTS